MAELRKLNELRIVAPFSGLFPIDQNIKHAIKENMESVGFDPSKPIDTWGNIVIDGHTRLSAAAEAGLSEVWVYEKTFADEQQALEYAIHNQRDRRNMTDGDIMRCVVALDKRNRHGGDRGNQYTGGKPGKAQSCALPGSKSAEQTAEVVGTSPRKIEQTRTVLDHASEETKAAVEEGQISINAAYKKTQEERKQEPKQAEARATKPTFNRTTDNVEWAWFTWNPVTGCKHGCNYCYARDIANRFNEEKFEPTFHPERLEAPHNTKVPVLQSDASEADKIGHNLVFVCSMADLFGEWVPQEWIDAVLSQVRMAPQWGFIFLTKNPKRLKTIDWPPNAIIGTTVDKQARVKSAEIAFREVNARVKFLSIEPMLESLTFQEIGNFDWVIIGGQSKSTQAPASQPKWEWVEHIWEQCRAAHVPYYWKPNLLVRPRQYPNGI